MDHSGKYVYFKLYVMQRNRLYLLMGLFVINSFKCIINIELLIVVLHLSSGGHRQNTFEGILIKVE